MTNTSSRPSDEKLIDGKQIAQQVREDLGRRVATLKERTGRVPGLAAIRVGDDPGSEVYVRMKRKACEKLGMYSEEHPLPADTSRETLLALVRELNERPEIHGILPQLPMPGHLDENEVIETVSPLKDVDGFHPYNVGRLSVGRPTYRSCTPAGIMHLLDASGVELKGAEAVIVGRSNIVGKPVALMLLERHATVTICHSRTTDLPAVCRRADILVAAVGRPKMLGAEHVREGAVVIDVGTNRLEDGSLCGDVDFAAVVDRVRRITPSPGGVGPMTITMLLSNTVQAFCRAEGIED